jgi:hypothetical protein
MDGRLGIAGRDFVNRTHAIRRGCGNAQSAAISLFAVAWALVAVSAGLAEPILGNQAFQAPLIPNASRIRARVVKYSIWDATLVSPQSHQTLYSLVLDVCGSEKVENEVSLVKPGERIEAFSRDALSADLFGRTIRSVVRARGDERGQRFWLRDIQLLSPADSCPVEQKAPSSGRQ